MRIVFPPVPPGVYGALHRFHTIRLVPVIEFVSMVVANISHMHTTRMLLDALSRQFEQLRMTIQCN